MGTNRKNFFILIILISLFFGLLFLVKKSIHISDSSLNDSEQEIITAILEINNDLIIEYMKTYPETVESEVNLVETDDLMQQEVHKYFELRQGEVATKNRIESVEDCWIMGYLNSHFGGITIEADEGIYVQYSNTSSIENELLPVEVIVVNKDSNLGFMGARVGMNFEEIQEKAYKNEVCKGFIHSQEFKVYYINFEDDYYEYIYVSENEDGSESWLVIRKKDKLFVERYAAPEMYLEMQKIIGEEEIVVFDSFYLLEGLRLWVFQTNADREQVHLLIAGKWNGVEIECQHLGYETTLKGGMIGINVDVMDLDFDGNLDLRVEDDEQMAWPGSYYAFCFRENQFEPIPTFPEAYTWVEAENKTYVYDIDHGGYRLLYIYTYDGEAFICKFFYLDRKVYDILEFYVNGELMDERDVSGMSDEEIREIFPDWRDQYWLG